MRAATKVIADAIAQHEYVGEDPELGVFRCRCEAVFASWSGFTEHRAERIRLALIVADGSMPAPSGRPFMTVQHLTHH